MIDENGKPKDYYDSSWDKLVQCMSADELYAFLSSGMGETLNIPSINKPMTITSDSPMGLHVGTLFPCYPIQASTFSTAVAQDIGSCIAQEALWNNISGWYAPTCNTHRTPFGGRNYEYYSEDTTLAGLYAAEVIKQAQKEGIYVQIKHFALNDQDTNRGDRGNFRNFDPYNGLCTYANEQSIREIYLRSFQYAIEKGKAHGVMTSYNRIGDTWSGGHYGLVTEVLRNEWGMQGNALTDYAGTFGYTYMNMNQGLRAGNDIWLHPSRTFPIADKTSASAIYYMQKAAKHVLYSEACSNRINGLFNLDGSKAVYGTPIYTWEILVPTIDVFISSVLIAGIILLNRRKKTVKPV